MRQWYHLHYFTRLEHGLYGPMCCSKVLTTFCLLMFNQIAELNIFFYIVKIIIKYIKNNNLSL